MKWSRYNHAFKSKRNGYLLYNSETNTFINLSEEFYDKALFFEKNPEDFQLEDKDILDEFIKHKIVVEDRNQYLYERRLKYYYNAFDSYNLGLALAPTSDCNFACPYCYEEGNKHQKYLTPELEDKIIDFIKKHTRTSILNLTWYGGEPLMGFASIVRILEKIQKINYIKLGLHNMPTNGYLLDETKIEFFREFPLTSIQITLDGNRECHNAKRVLKNGGATFDKILGNIDHFVERNPDTQTFIRMNLDKENCKSFGDIYRELTQRYKGYKVNVYPAYVRDYSDSCSTNCTILNRKDKVEFFKILQEQLGDEIINFKPNPAFGGCGTTRLNYYVVGPEGELYKCWNDLGNPKEIVGYVDKEDFTNYTLLSRYLAGPSPTDDKECIECKILPVCEGGCIWVRHKNLYENKDYNYMCDSRKDNMDEVFELHYEQLKRSLTFV